MSHIINNKIWYYSIISSRSYCFAIFSFAFSWLGARRGVTTEAGIYRLEALLASLAKLKNEFKVAMARENFNFEMLILFENSALTLTTRATDEKFALQIDFERRKAVTISRLAALCVCAKLFGGNDENQSDSHWSSNPASKVYLNEEHFSIDVLAMIARVFVSLRRREAGVERGVGERRLVEVELSVSVVS